MQTDQTPDQQTSLVMAFEEGLKADLMEGFVHGHRKAAKRYLAYSRRPSHAAEAAEGRGRYARRAKGVK